MRIFRSLLFTLFFGGVVAVSAQDNTGYEADTTSYETDYYEEAEEDDEDAQDARALFDHYDSSQVQVRSFNAATLDSLKHDPALSYGYTQTAVSLWDAFWLWIEQQINGLTPESDGYISFDALMIILFIGVLTYVIIRLMKRGHLKMFYGQTNTKEKNLFAIEENIHEMDFEKLLEEAAKNGNYRLAIRLFFLYGLKMLADKQHIYWEPGKTNQEYVNELQVADLKKDFNRLNYYFEYAWYGDFAVTADLFSQVNTLFVNWKKRIGS